MRRFKKFPAIPYIVRNSTLNLVDPQRATAHTRTARRSGWGKLPTGGVEFEVDVADNLLLVGIAWQWWCSARSLKRKKLGSASGKGLRTLRVCLHTVEVVLAEAQSSRGVFNHR